MGDYYDFTAAFKKWHEGGIYTQWTPSAMEGSYEDQLRALWLAHLKKIVPPGMPLPSYVIILSCCRCLQLWQQ